MWFRFDCRTNHAENPDIAAEFEQAKAICAPRAQAAGTAASAAVPMGYGMAGAISSGIQAGITQAQVSTATAQSCMAERGYTQRTQSEDEALCAATRESWKAKPVPPARRKQSVPKPKAGPPV